MSSSLLYQRYLDALITTDWEKIQMIQSVHDELFHSDIAHMDNPRKIQHYILHLSKYAGRIAELGVGLLGTEVTPQIQHAVVVTMCHTLSMVVSATSALKMRMVSDGIPAHHRFTENWTSIYFQRVGGVAGSFSAMTGISYLPDDRNGTDVNPRGTMFLNLRDLQQLCLYVMITMIEDDPIETYFKSLAETQRKHPMVRYLRPRFTNLMVTMGIVDYPVITDS